MMNLNGRTLRRRTPDNEAVNSLIATGISPPLARIYTARGITSANDLDTGILGLAHYSRLLHAEKAATLLADAIRDGKKLLCIGDFDVDGATATTVCVQGLRAMGANIAYLVPNRFRFGYGLSAEIVRVAAERNPDILITVDNGMSSIEGVTEANRLGMQVIITDHHLPIKGITPEAACIVNPNQEGCPFPSKNLPGVGVIWYVLAALRAELRKRGILEQDSNEPNLYQLLDLVALGVIADVVKLDRNNRILVEAGLKLIRAGKTRPGIKALFQVAKTRIQTACSSDLGFNIGPRLNAAGRLDDMSQGIECLLSDNLDRALPLAQTLNDLNNERKSIESDMKDSALEILEVANADQRNALVLHDPSWHQGVIGILASRLKEQYHRPAIAFADAGDGLLKGSGRSVTGLHLRDALDWVNKTHPGLIQKFGGHAAACGLTLKTQNLAPFSEAFETAVTTLLGDEISLDPVIETDGELTPHEMTLELADELALGIWGQGFPEPLFDGKFKVLQQSVVGEKHLKLRLELDGAQIAGIYFFNTELLPDEATLVYAVCINEFNGLRSLQLIIRDRHT